MRKQPAWRFGLIDRARGRGLRRSTAQPHRRRVKCRFADKRLSVVLSADVLPLMAASGPSHAESLPVRHFGCVRHMTDRRLFQNATALPPTSTAARPAGPGKRTCLGRYRAITSNPLRGRCRRRLSVRHILRLDVRGQRNLNRHGARRRQKTRSKYSFSLLLASLGDLLAVQILPTRADVMNRKSPTCRALLESFISRASRLPLGG